MAIGDEVSNSIDANLSFDELLSTFHDLFNECKLIIKKYKLLKKEHASLVSDLDRLKVKHNSCLTPCTKCDELEILKKENLLLKETSEKFEVGSKFLNMILANKGHVHRKSGIRFVSSSHQNPTTFVKGPTLHVSPRNKCNFCCKFGNVAYHYPFKKSSPHKLIWVPKRTSNNSMQHDKQFRSIFEAPKVKWVPKNHPLL